MDHLETSTAVRSACPVCDSRSEEGALFCARCGAFLRDSNGKAAQKRASSRIGAPPEGLEPGFVQLLAEITALQRDLLRQFRQGQAIQVRQFERALQAQAQGLEKTLAHADSRARASEQKLELWQRWTAAFGAAGLILLVAISRLA